MSNATVQLRRSLGLWDAVFIGIIMVQPTAPMPLFGVVSDQAKGHVVTTILIAMCAMLFTAISYGRMARAYPGAGSVYTYVGQEIHPALGFLTGWAMLLDYVVNPLICTIWCSKAAMNVLPWIPYPLWAFFFAGLFTMLNLRKIHSTARTNEVLTAAMSIAILWMLVATARFVLNLPHVDAAYFLRPFYDPKTFSVAAVSTGTSLAVLTFIGFDGISTLSEEVENPRRNILLATVLVVLIIGVLSAVEVYAAQLVWPHGEKFPDADTAYVHVAGLAGGAILFQIVNLTLIIANIGSGAGAQLAGARLLYGMGRDGALPKGFFGYIDPKTNIPRNNVLAVGAVTLAGAFLITYETGAELLNFGAFIGFMGVNIAAFLRYWIRGESRNAGNFLPPLLGFAICFYMWICLRTPSQIAGSIWLLLGLLYGAYKTKGFRENLVKFDVPDE
jgi:putrescine importer